MNEKKNYLKIDKCNICNTLMMKNEFLKFKDEK